MQLYTENHLVEQPAIQLMQHELGWDVVNCYGEWDGGASVLGRDGKREVVLVSRLRQALQRLNPDLPAEALEGAVEERGILNVRFWILNGRGGVQGLEPIQASQVLFACVASLTTLLSHAL